MAKKKAVAKKLPGQKDLIPDAHGGRGKKTCPDCGTQTGARTQQCQCGHVFIAKTRKAKGKAGLDDPRRIIQAVKEAGGVAEIRKHLAAVEKARAIVEEKESALSIFGGADGATAAIAFVEELKSL